MKNRLRQAWPPALAGVLAVPVARAEDIITTAVYAQKDSGYKRTKLADGTFAREYYVMSNAGRLPGSLQDNQQVKVPFATIAGILARYLAKEAYFPAEKQDSAQLVLVIHWGVTIPFNDASYAQAVGGVTHGRNNMDNARVDWMAKDAKVQTKAGSNKPATTPLGGGNPFVTAEEAQAQAMEEVFENDMLGLMLESGDRMKANEKNAKLLGYLRELNERNGIQRWAGGGHYYDDLVADLEEMRYYVVISAYDFKKAVKEKNPKLFWVTRVSIRSPGNSFADRLDDMIANASKYFGHDSGRLVRQYGREGRVEIGESKVMGVVAEPTEPDGKGSK